MIAIVWQFRMPVESLAVARPLMRAVVEATRAEEGCIEYNYAEDVLDPGLIRVSEVWDSYEQLMAHMATPHMKTWGEERIALGLSGRSITAYTVTDAQQV